VGDIHQMFYLMDISLSYYAQPLQQLLPDQDFWMTAFGCLLPLTSLKIITDEQPLIDC
jgi:hypothetical protein